MVTRAWGTFVLQKSKVNVLGEQIQLQFIIWAWLAISAILLYLPLTCNSSPFSICGVTTITPDISTYWQRKVLSYSSINSLHAFCTGDSAGAPDKCQRLGGSSEGQDRHDTGQSWSRANHRETSPPPATGVFGFRNSPVCPPRARCSSVVEGISLFVATRLYT